MVGVYRTGLVITLIQKKKYFEVETGAPGCLKVILVVGEETKEEALAGSELPRIPLLLGMLGLMEEE